MAVAPTILTPAPGDVLGTSVLVTGVSTCRPVMLMISPPGTDYVEVPVDPPPANTWSYIFNDVPPGNITIKVCCKRTPPPHGPCSEVSKLRVEET
jgi:hypothetical protein